MDQLLLFQGLEYAADHFPRTADLAGNGLVGQALDNDPRAVFTELRALLQHGAQAAVDIEQGDAACAFGSEAGTPDQALFWYRLVTLVWFPVQFALLVWMLAVGVAGSYFKLQVDYLLASERGSYLFEAIRWLGWLPLAAAYLWARERIALPGRRPAAQLDR